MLFKIDISGEIKESTLVLLCYCFESFVNSNMLIVSQSSRNSNRFRIVLSLLKTSSAGLNFGE